MKGHRRSLATGLGLLACLVARTSWAQMCSDATMFPNPIYISGSTAYQPTAALFAAQMGNLTGTDKATIIYQNGLGSCDGPPAIMSGTPLTSGTTATVWTPGPNFANDKTSVTKGSCTIDGTHAADIGPSDIFWKNCPNLAGVTQPADIKDFQGPVQAMIFVVSAPQNTSFTAMSAQQAQLIWGCGMGGMVTPFDDNMGIMQRNSELGLAGFGRQGDQRSAHRVLRGDEQRRRRRRHLDCFLRDDAQPEQGDRLHRRRSLRPEPDGASSPSPSSSSTRPRPTTRTRPATPRIARTCATGTTGSGARSTSSPRSIPPACHEPGGRKVPGRDVRIDVRDGVQLRRAAVAGRRHPPVRDEGHARRRRHPRTDQAQDRQHRIPAVARSRSSAPASRPAPPARTATATAPAARPATSATASKGAHDDDAYRN